MAAPGGQWHLAGSWDLADGKRQRTKPNFMSRPLTVAGVSPKMLFTVDVALDGLGPHAHVRKLLETPVPGVHVVALTLRVASAADGPGTASGHMGTKKSGRRRI